jgi:hypothetical protein
MSFEYSQNKIHDFLDCPRKFELRYLEKRIWPGIKTQPIQEFEQHVENGRKFHLFAQQLLIGIDAEKIEAQIDNDQLRTWWNSLFLFTGTLKGFTFIPECVLRTPLKQYRLVGIFDLLAFKPGEKFYIFDWKTNLKKPIRSQLKNSIQTRVYPFLLASNGSQWNSGNKIDPDQIEMVYWFSNFPGQSEGFLYDRVQFESDQNYLFDLIQKIEGTPSGSFQLTDNYKICKYCNYRSLCDRGVEPGDYKNLDEDEFEYFYEEIEDIDLSQIGEMAF